MSVSKLVTIQSFFVARMNRHGHGGCAGLCSACLMSMGGENTATSSFKSVEHVIEATAKRRLFFGNVSHTDIHTKNCIVWTAARHRAECQPYVILGKILINCWRLALRINKDGTTKMRKQRNEKKMKTEVVQKEWRKQRKAGKVKQEVI